MEDRLYHSIAEFTGHTPLVELTNYEKQQGLQARLLGKLEYYNPSGSIKDRIALRMIQEAEREGKIRQGDTVMDFTSGNTGIGLAAYANALGYRFAAVIQPGVSAERTQILKAYGAIFLEFSDIPGVMELVETEGLVFPKFYALLQSYADDHGYYFINQGQNLANPVAHYETTGPEIWRAAGGKVDYAVMLVGTAGSMVGIGRYLREKNPDVKIIGAQPHPVSRKDSSYPERNTIDGVLAFHDVTEDKIPYFFKKYHFRYDECIDVIAEDAYETGRALVKSDGLFLGQSAAAAVWAAAQVAKRPEAKGKNIVVVLADNAFKYLTTNMYG